MSWSSWTQRRAPVSRFDGELPGRSFVEVMGHLGIESDHFAAFGRFRSPHFRKRENGDWTLRRPVRAR
jgi:hypothetical protein